MHERAAKIGKGDLVRITGRVRQKSYESNGERHYTVDLIVDRMANIIKPRGAHADRDDDVPDDNVPFRSPRERSRPPLKPRQERREERRAEKECVTPSNNPW